MKQAKRTLCSLLAILCLVGCFMLYRRHVVEQE